jgi:outer membrane receptor protein involved in Fe transport
MCTRTIVLARIALIVLGSAATAESASLVGTLTAVNEGSVQVRTTRERERSFLIRVSTAEGDDLGSVPLAVRPPMNAGRDKTGVTRSSTTQLTDNLTWSKGRHTMRFGVDVRRLGYHDIESFGGANDFGQFVFSAGQFSGNAFADFLLGLPTYTYVAQSGPDIDATTTQYAAYAQDEWRVGEKLTVNVGLRYAVLPPFRDRNGNLGAFNYADGG